MTDFQSLATIDSNNETQLEQWLTNIKTLYQNNKTEHFITILADLNSLAKLNPDFYRNNNETIKKLITQIEFVNQTIGERENPQQLVKRSRTRRESVVPQLEAQKEREEQIRTRLHSRTPSAILSSPINLPQTIMDKTNVDINQYLTKVIGEWKVIIKNNDSSQKNNLPFISKLIPLIETALSTNTKQGYQELLTNWTNNYPQWDDKARWDLKKLGFLIQAYNNPVQSNTNSSEEVEELKLEIENLKRKLVEANQRTTLKTKEWQQASERIDNEVKKATKSTTAKFKSFVNPNDPQALEKSAKDKLNMITQTELSEEVAKSLIPLQVWENTFPEQSAEVVKTKQDQLIAELTPWQETFTDKTAPQIKEEMETLTAEKKQARLDRKTMELEKDDYKEDVERMTGEVDNYYQEYQRFMNLNSQQRTRIDQLEEQIYNLGQTPIEEVESDQEEEDDNNESNSETNESAQQSDSESQADNDSVADLAITSPKESDKDSIFEESIVHSDSETPEQDAKSDSEEITVSKETDRLSTAQIEINSN